jgi:hypothetical protein
MSPSDTQLSYSYAVIGLILPRCSGAQTALEAYFMQYSQVTSFMAERGELMLSGDMDTIATAYIYPLPVFLTNRRLVVGAPYQASAMLRLQRLSMIRRGVVAVRPKVTAIDVPRNGRFRVWVDWLELAIPSEGTRSSSAIYYCSNQPSGPKIEMINYTRLSAPELEPQLAALSMSA